MVVSSTCAWRSSNSCLDYAARRALGISPRTSSSFSRRLIAALHRRCALDAHLEIAADHPEVSSSARALLLTAQHARAACDDGGEWVATAPTRRRSARAAVRSDELREYRRWGQTSSRRSAHLAVRRGSDRAAGRRCSSRRRPTSRSAGTRIARGHARRAHSAHQHERRRVGVRALCVRARLEDKAAIRPSSADAELVLRGTSSALRRARPMCAPSSRGAPSRWG